MKIALAVSFIACSLLAGAAKAQTRAQSALGGDWRVNFILPMEAQPENARLIVSEAEATVVAAAAGKRMSEFFAASLDPEIPMLVPLSDGLPIVRGQRRSRAVVQPASGVLPYTAAGRKEADGFPPDAARDNPEDRPNPERCLVGQGQPPLSSFALDSQIQIVVTRDHVVIHSEYGDDVRIIPLAASHQPRELWGWLGDSIGRWEGATLIIETVGLPDADRWRIAPILIVPGEATVVERLTVIAPKELLYQFTVVDPKTYSGPWLGEFSWYRTDQRIYEHACHEGNYSLGNILAGARYEEAVARAAAAR
jgi:hypothetical protein